MVDEQRPRLGRGLAALLGDAQPETGPAPDRGVRKIPIEWLRPNARNPRKSFDDEALEELANSIREKGLIQPILARPVDGSGRAFEIIAGERRWRASQRAGLHEVPVVTVNATDRESLELAIVENVQRADLNQVEEARGYEQLMTEFGYTQLDLSKIIGKSRSHVANTLRLLNLPASVLDLVESNAISAGHARSLLNFENPEAVARRIVDEKLSVRDVEELARHKDDGIETTAAPKNNGVARQADPNIADLERTLSNVLGMKVEISHKGDSGAVRIRYANIDQFDSICDRLLHKP